MVTFDPFKNNLLIRTALHRSLPPQLKSLMPLLSFEIVLNHGYYDPAHLNVWEAFGGL
jgi:hypothetical protein